MSTGHDVRGEGASDTSESAQSAGGVTTSSEAAPCGPPVWFHERLIAGLSVASGVSVVAWLAGVIALKLPAWLVVAGAPAMVVALVAMGMLTSLRVQQRRTRARAHREDAAPVQQAETPRVEVAETPKAPTAEAWSSAQLDAIQAMLSASPVGAFAMEPEAGVWLGANAAGMMLLELEAPPKPGAPLDLWRAPGLKPLWESVLAADRQGRSEETIGTLRGDVSVRARRCGEGAERFVWVTLELELMPVTSEWTALRRSDERDLLDWSDDDDHPQVFHTPPLGRVNALGEGLAMPQPEPEPATTSLYEEMAALSHDLRTPMVSLRGYMEMLQRGDLGPLNAPQDRCLTNSLRSLDRMMVMVDNVLELGNLSNDERGRAHIEVFNLTQLGEEVADMYRMRADDIGVDFALRGLVSQGKPSPPEPEIMARADRIRLQRVMTNLLDNALRFTPEGGKVRLYLRGATSQEAIEAQRKLGQVHGDHAAESAGLDLGWVGAPSPERWLLVRVQDSGCGIPEDDLPNVFERYFTQGLDRNNRAGSGLGLAITDSIVRMHFGLIEVQSQVGVGTVFSVWLPVRESVEAVAASSGVYVAPRWRGARAEPSPMLPSPSRGHVLVIDDDPDCVEFAQVLLQHNGYAVETLLQPSMLSDTLRRAMPDVVLLDYSLTGDDDGLSVLRQLKQSAEASHVPVVMVSGHTDAALQSACLEAGAFGFLTKPYNIDTLLEILGEARASRAERAALRQIPS